MIHYGYPVAEALGFLHVVSGVHDGPASFLQREYVLENGITGLRIHSDRRLVEQHQIRIVHDSGGEVEPALHASGIGPDPVATPVGKSHEFERTLCPLTQPAGSQAVHPTQKAKILFSGEFLVKGQSLRRDSDPRADRRFEGMSQPLDHDAAAVGLEKADGKMHGRTLSRAVRTKQSEDLTAMNLQGESFDGDYGAVTLPDVVERKHDVALYHRDAKSSPALVSGRWASGGFLSTSEDLVRFGEAHVRSGWNNTVRRRTPSKQHADFTSLMGLPKVSLRLSSRSDVKGEIGTVPLRRGRT